VRAGSTACLSSITGIAAASNLLKSAYNTPLKRNMKSDEVPKAAPSCIVKLRGGPIAGPLRVPRAKVTRPASPAVATSGAIEYV